MQNVSGFKDWQKKAVLKLLAEGATVPFMARYRKEATGHLDEVAIIAIQEAEEAAQQLLKRKQFVLESIQEQGKLSAELEKAIRSAQTLTELEDLYLPYKARRKTRADLAREKGLEPLARGIWEQRTPYLSALLKTHLPVGMKAEEALNGARDIIAEWINEDAALRAKLRDLWAQMGFIQAKPARGKKEADEAQKFRDYFEYEEPLKRVQHHRLMAVSRGADVGMLSVKVDAPWADRVWPLLKRHCLKGYGESSDQVALAVEDAYKRLLQPSLENEWMTQARALAEEDAVSVFALNVRQLLLAAPLGEKSVLAIDPGFRTGCKVVALDAYGSLIFHSVIYPHEPQRQWETAAADLKRWAQEFGIQAIAVGNGTAGRETEDLCRDVFEPLGLEVYSVNESGASVYSASAIAREEFPHEDVTVRGAVSIGRRLQDPLSELVKIDPKSIGVGQYQHDVNPGLLKKRLDQVMESAVNAVGVNLNTAGKYALAKVSGLGPVLAENIVQYRQQHGSFRRRSDLLNVPRLGAKAFEQCAGFLRIRGEDPVENTGIHPERYPVLAKMAHQAGVGIPQLVGEPVNLERLDLTALVDETSGLGLPTLSDIVAELRKPGLDIRGQAEASAFDRRVRRMEDLEVGMELHGVVTNLTNFGAFVDLGVKQDGLVHISQICHEFLKHPSEKLSLGQSVRARVTELDLPRKRIGLTLKF